jgi:crossover junction endodeoxyribonuclease RuvC
MSTAPSRVSNNPSRERDVRVMGVDPGLTRCGLSVVESGRGRHIIALDVDVVRTPADESLPRRLLAISDAVEYWLDVHRPDVSPSSGCSPNKMCRR